MSISTTTIQQLRQLLLADPALQARLQQSQSPQEMASLLAGIATTNGIAVTSAELEQFLGSLSCPTAATTLSDQQLESVAGGISSEGFGVLSGLTFWIACAIMSYGNEPITWTEGGKEYTAGARDMKWC